MNAAIFKEEGVLRDVSWNRSLPRSALPHRWEPIRSPWPPGRGLNSTLVEATKDPSGIRCSRSRNAGDRVCGCHLNGYGRQHAVRKSNYGVTLSDGRRQPQSQTA